MNTASVLGSTFLGARRAGALALLAALAVTASGVRADAAAATAPAAKSELCLQLNRIRQTRVVDDRTVLFYYTQKEIYKNVLPNKCSGLELDRAFEYKTSINQICSVDVITPLTNNGGAFMPLTSCGLGRFELIDKAAADKLIADAKPGHHSAN